MCNPYKKAKVCNFKFCGLTLHQKKKNAHVKCWIKKPLRRPLLLVLQDARFPSRRKILDKSGWGCRWSGTDNASLLVRDPLQTPRKLALLRRHTFPGITDYLGAADFLFISCLWKKLRVTSYMQPCRIGHCSTERRSNHNGKKNIPRIQGELK